VAVWVGVGGWVGGCGWMGVDVGGWVDVRVYLRFVRAPA